MSLITPRFNYEPIKRTSVEGRRLYLTPGGNPVPSVTTVLSATKPEQDRRALKEWQNNVGHERAQAITNQAANRGTKMHTYVEDYIRTGVMADRPKNPFSLTAHYMAENLIRKGLCNVNEVWGIEVGVYMPQMYAGTTDCVGVHNGDEAIIDHKQSNRPKASSRMDDYRLQTAAYAAAHNQIHGTKIRKGVLFVSIKPETDADGFIKLTEDRPTWRGQDFQEIIIEGTEFDHWTNEWWKRLEQYYSQL